MPTTPNTIIIAKISQFLAFNDIEGRSTLGGGIDMKLPRLLYMVRKNVEWLYDLDPTDDTLIKTKNYLYALCAPYSNQASNIAGIGGGGSISPVTPISLPTPYYFTVDGSSFIADGETTVQMPVTWQGYNISVARGAMVQTTVNTEPSYFSYNTTTRELILTPAVVAGELIALVPV